MKLSPMLGASAVALAAFLATTGAASADSSSPGSKSGSDDWQAPTFMINANDPNANEKACADHGGKVVTGANRQKGCVVTATPLNNRQNLSGQ